MADEKIVIEIQDKISASISTKLSDIETKSARAAIAQERLQQAQDRTATGANRLQASAERLATSQIRTATAAKYLETATAKAAIANKKLEESQNKVSKSSDDTKNSFDTMANFMRGGIGAGGYAIALQQIVNVYKAIAMAGIDAIATVGKLSNEYIELENKLRVVTNSSEQLANVTSRVFSVANETRGSVDEVATAFARFDRAMSTMGASQEESIRLTETINKAMTISGAKAGEQAAGLLQLSQAFNKGKLDGDEFRTVMELMPSIADAIARQMKVTRGELLNLAPQGKITGQVLREALAGAAIEIDAQFAKTVPTISQSLSVFHNNLVEMLGTAEKGSGIMADVSSSIISIGNNMKLITPDVTLLFSAVGALYQSLTTLGLTSDNTYPKLDILRKLMQHLGQWVAYFADEINFAKVALMEFFSVITQAGASALGKLADIAVSINNFTGKEIVSNNLISGVKELSIRLENTSIAAHKSAVGIGTSERELDKLNKRIVETDAAFESIKRQQEALKPLNEVINKVATAWLDTKNSIEQLNAVKDKTPEQTKALADQQKQLTKLADTWKDLQEKKSVIEGNANLRGTGVAAPVAPPKAKKAKTKAERPEDKFVQTPVEKIMESLYQGSAQAALTKYNDTIAAANELLAAHKITQQEAASAIVKAKESYDTINNPMKSVLDDLAQEQSLLGYVGSAYEVENRLLQIRNDQLKKGHVLNASEEETLRKKLEQMQRASQVQSELNNVYGQTQGGLESVVVKMDALNKAMQNGYINADYYKAAFAQLQIQYAQFKLTQQDATGTDFLVASLDKVMNGYKGLLSGLSDAFGDFFNTMVEGFADSAAKAIMEGKSLSDMMKDVTRTAIEGLISGLIKLGVQYAINAALGQSLATAAVAAQAPLAATAASLWAGPAALASLATLGTNGIAANAAIAETVGFAKTLALLGSGFASGGYTGQGATGDVAGVVHGQEFVVNAAATAKNRATLEAMNAGKSVGTSSSGVNVKIENYGTSKSFETQQIDENTIRLIARDEADSSVSRNVPSIMASQFANPNSRASKSLRNNTTVAVRR